MAKSGESGETKAANRGEMAKATIEMAKNGVKMAKAAKISAKK
jgi:hypothetical protein